MKVPISWLKEFVDISLPLDELIHLLTMAGLEVEGLTYVGLPMPSEQHGAAYGPHTSRRELTTNGISWDPEKIVVGEIREVMPHPNADRLVLCRLSDGITENIVLTGAPNLFPYKGQGPLKKPLKVAYAKEGARIFDGHQPGQVLMTLKRAKIRGVESFSMACSEKELGISDDHEGIIILDDTAPAGMALVDYMGDAVLDISIIPNIARAASILGVAREVAALTGHKLRKPSLDVLMDGPAIEKRAAIKILNPTLNPRFVLGLVEKVEIRPSPYEVQRRLKLAGMRPINNIVDATNYVMLEVGQPLHAFDYDVLVQRAGGQSPTIITRTAHPDERLTTLDGVERSLNDFTVLVCDTAGALSIAGVMGGSETEVSERTRNVLLEGAAWNFINIRRTMTAQHLISEASFRFSRGVHPAMAERGVRRGLELMRRWSGGVVAGGLVDSYPLPPHDPTLEITPADVHRWLGIELAPGEIANLLERLEFKVEVKGETIHATTPDHRLDIGEGLTGVADLMEEVARVYGYEKIPETRMADALPPQHGNPDLVFQDNLRDLLVNLGLQELITYRMTSPEREARLLPGHSNPDPASYLTLANPIASDRIVMRRSLLSSVMEVVERNARFYERLAFFEVGPVFFPKEGQLLPAEPLRLAIVLTGPRALPGWQPADTDPMDFFDLKGIMDELLVGLHLEDIRYEAVEHPAFHPGKSSRLLVGGREAGILGELHPLVREHYELPPSPLLAADIDLEVIQPQVPEYTIVRPISTYPPVLEDLAVVVDETIPAERVEQVIRQAGGELLVGLRLFDVYRGDQVEAGKKSLAYSLTYQAPDRTLIDLDAVQIREKIVQALKREIGAILRR